MKVTVLGASGFIGQHLLASLRGRGDEVVTGSLRAGTAAAAARLCAGSDAVVNLAGAAVAQRWTRAHKEEFRRSRVDRTRELVEELAKLPAAERPRAYVVSSAIGYYGTSETATFTEESGPGSGYLAEICVALEREAGRVRELGMRLAVLRIGVVLGAEGGMLKALMPVYRLGLGGPVATGRQWISWIHVMDQVRLFVAAIDGLEGVLNGTAPEPVTNAVFAKALGRAMHRPALLATPGFAMTLALGEGATIVTEGQRVMPRRTQEMGFAFQYPRLGEALAAAVG